MDFAKLPCLIRAYLEPDAEEVGKLIATTYATFNLDFAEPDELRKLLGPFQHAGSPAPAHQEAIVHVIRAPMVYVADAGGEIVGVLRGRSGRLASRFVRGYLPLRYVEAAQVRIKECGCETVGRQLMCR